MIYAPKSIRLDMITMLSGVELRIKEVDLIGRRKLRRDMKTFLSQKVD